MNGQADGNETLHVNQVITNLHLTVVMIPLYFKAEVNINGQLIRRKIFDYSIILEASLLC